MLTREINLGDSSVDTLGLALTNRDFDSGRVWFEIFLNGPAIATHESNILPYVFNHELLHVLGLEHTFDDSDGDFYLSTDPNLSATPEETVMSYRTPISEYPSDITEADYTALETIWGKSSVININSTLFDATVYRLYHPIEDTHLFTSNLFEVDLLTGQSNSLLSMRELRIQFA